jgi:hypothetical protein
MLMANKKPAEKRDGKAAPTVRVLPGEEWLTVAQVAARLDVSARAVRSMAQHHREELQPFTRQVVSGAARPATEYALDAVTLFACWSRSEKGQGFRSVVLQLVQRERCGNFSPSDGRGLLEQAVKALESERDALGKKEQTKREALDDVAALGSEGLRILELVDEDINETAKRFRIPLRRDDA